MSPRGGVPLDKMRRHSIFTPLSLLISAFAVLGAAPIGDEATEVSMLRLNNVEYTVGDPLPDWVTALDGKSISISGYMRNGTIEGEGWFDLTNDNCGCGTSNLPHFVRVTIEEGKTSFTPTELQLVGTFAAGEVEDEDGFVESVFRLTIAKLDR